MNTSYIKLSAKKHLVQSHFKCFLISVLPYVTIILLVTLNYYLYILLNKTDFGFLPYYLLYAKYFPTTVLTVSICLSFLLLQYAKGVSDFYFFCRMRNMKTSFRKLLKSFSFRKVLTLTMLSILKFLLSLAWSAFYLLPSVTIGATLYYYINSYEYIKNVAITLFVSALMLFVTGISFLYVTLKRYSMCSYILFSEEEKETLKIIAESIERTDGKCIKYSIYCLSFLAWNISCVFVIPVIYVLPYRVMSKYSFMYFSQKPVKAGKNIEKPIIFFIPKRA